LDKKNKEGAISIKDFQEMINTLDVIYFKGEFKGKLLIYNNTLNKILGLDPSIDLTGSSVSQFFSDSEVLQKYHNKLEKNGFVEDFVVNIKKSNGSTLYIQINAHLIQEGDLKLVEGTATDITEKFMLEQNLKEKVKHFNLIIDNSNDLIAILNRDFKHEYINKNAYLNALGYKEDEVIGKRPIDFSHPDDIKKISKAIKEGLITGEMLEEFRIKHKNGHYVWVETKGTFLKENSQIIGAIFISRDTTEKKEAEQRLKESEENYRNLVEDAQEGVWALDENEDTIFVNPRIGKMLGYTKFEMMGKNLHSFIPDSMETLIKGNRNKREKGIEEIYELQLVKKDGTLIYTEVKAAPIIDENRQYKGSFAYITDITGRKIAEQKLKESENKYRTLFESSTDGIYSTDMEGSFIEFNEAFLKMLGYSREELLNKKSRQITPPEWYDLDDNITFTQLAEGESKIYEKEFKQKDGSIIPISIRFWILHDEQGDPYRIWAIVRDITDRKQMEYELKEINRLKSEFLRRASHELKTPLVSIKGFTDLILSGYSEDLNPQIVSNLEEINKGCERLQIIINDLLRTSKSESLELKPKLESEDLSFLINYCAEALHPLVAKREHSINMNIHDSIITKFEKEEIHDVISNLLINAIKYTPPGGWIDIKTEIKDSFVIVSIKDNGIGFTEEEKGKIFHQFGKIERYGQGLDLGIDGTGLGLYISKRIIESHGGKIWMTSEGRNKGSTFHFSLPLIKD